MSQNPYAPPTAAVADPPPPTPIPRPREVTVAVRLLWLSFALGLSSGLERMEWVDVMESTVGLVVMGVYSGLLVWLILKIARGRNWARVVYTILLLLSYVSICSGWYTYFLAYRGHAELVALDVLDTLSDIAGLYFLFTRAANAWFKHPYTTQATIEIGK